LMSINWSWNNTHQLTILNVFHERCS
jgi:hypothetical protein